MNNKIVECTVCKAEYKFNLFWEIHKWWLRTTEFSLLWENCCSKKCYTKLLEKLISGKWKLG
jgi:hypothetical protein